MGKRTIETNSIAMALIYRYDCLGTTFISYEQAKEFDRVINENLEVKNSECGVGQIKEVENKLYYVSFGYDGKLYAIIDPNKDMYEARRYHVYNLPTDVIEASLMPNALDAIGMELVSGQLKEKKKKTKRLKK